MRVRRVESRPCIASTSIGGRRGSYAASEVHADHRGSRRNRMSNAKPPPHQSHDDRTYGRFKDKVAIVTGGGSAPGSGTKGVGVGTAISQLLASEGCLVAVVDRDAQAARATVEAISEAGGNASAFVRD